MKPVSLEESQIRTRLPAHREALGPVGVHSHQLTCTLILREI